MTIALRPRPIRWSCGVHDGHEHRDEADAARCIHRATISAPYGWCCFDGCTKRGMSRRDGFDLCEGGHRYPSGLAIPGRG